MNRKKIIISVICCFCIVFINCSDQIIDYAVDSDWVYINNTEHTIKVNESFTIGPNELYVFDFGGMGGEELPVPEDYVPPFFAGHTIITIDGEIEIAIASGGITNRENYIAVEQISDRRWRFTYIFTEAEIDALLAEHEQEQEPSE